MDLDAFVSDPLRLTGGRTYKSVLEDARRLIANQDLWCQGAFARDRYGRTVKPMDPSAAQWSMMGAVAKSSNLYGIIDLNLLRYMNQLVEYKHPGGQFDCAGDFNDYFDHATVLAFLDEAIARWGVMETQD